MADSVKDPERALAQPLWASLCIPSPASPLQIHGPKKVRLWLSTNMVPDSRFAAVRAAGKVCVWRGGDASLCGVGARRPHLHDLPP